MMPRQLLPYLLAMVLLAIGIYAIVGKKNLIKIIVGIIVMEYAVNLFLVLIGYRSGGRAPIITKQVSENPQRLSEFVKTAVDPLPQALILTSIVIGLATLILMIAIAIRIYEKYGTFDVSKIRKLRG
jgi:multicomponent Na+:H+ antiporter subunit C